MSLKHSLAKGRELDSGRGAQSLLGMTFTVWDWKLVETRFGLRKLVAITVDGNDEHEGVWLNGVIIDRQLDRLREDGLLPATVKLSQDPDINDAWILVDPDDVDVTQVLGAAPQERGA